MLDLMRFTFIVLHKVVNFLCLLLYLCFDDLRFKCEDLFTPICRYLVFFFRNNSEAWIYLWDPSCREHEIAPRCSWFSSRDGVYPLLILYFFSCTSTAHTASSSWKMNKSWTIHLPLHFFFYNVHRRDITFLFRLAVVP